MRNLTRAEAEALRYDNAAEYAKCARLLHLMNVETVRGLTNSTERYPFLAHKGRRPTPRVVSSSRVAAAVTMDRRCGAGREA